MCSSTFEKTWHHWYSLLTRIYPPLGRLELLMQFSIFQGKLLHLIKCLKTENILLEMPLTTFDKMLSHSGLILANTSAEGYQPPLATKAPNGKQGSSPHLTNDPTISILIIKMLPHCPIFWSTAEGTALMYLRTT